MTADDLLNKLQRTGAFSVLPDGTGRMIYTQDGRKSAGVDLRAAAASLPEPETYKLLPNLWTAQAFMAATAAMCEYGDHLYTVGHKPGAGPQAHLAKIDKATGAVETMAFDNSDGLHRNPTGLAELNGKLYVIMGLNHFLLAEVDPETWKYRDVLTLRGVANSSRGSICVAGRFLWVAPNGSRTLYQVDPRTSEYLQFASHQNQNCIRFDGRDLFVTCHDPARVIRFDLEGRMVDQKLLTDLNPEFNSVSDHFAFTGGDTLWTGIDSNSGPLTGTLLRSPRASFEASAIGPQLLNAPTKGVFEDGEGWVYQTFADQLGGPPRIVRFRPENPEVFERYTLGPSQRYSAVCLLFPPSDVFYSLSNNGIVAAHRKADL